ncbi:hypothetical protein [Streptomyces sp. NBC_01268]|uniref:hypothetical protein n=1 Tax=Streptomyces sp. NBC_01268 TaxID=2903806 RepID=UPI002E32AE10|nr:hypothetical protein [Streptomyces sp. NBC_01268]
MFFACGFARRHDPSATLWPRRRVIHRRKVDIRIKASSTAAVAAPALIPILGGAALATAGETGVQALNCPGSGDITPGDKCTTLSNGVLMINETSTGSFVGLQYYKSGGSAVTARLGYLRQGVNRWSGWQSMTAVNT